jgi:hypothetical protein
MWRQDYYDTFVEPTAHDPALVARLDKIEEKLDRLLLMAELQQSHPELKVESTELVRNLRGIRIRE